MQKAEVATAASVRSFCVPRVMAWSLRQLGSPCCIVVQAQPVGRSLHSVRRCAKWGGALPVCGITTLYRQVPAEKAHMGETRMSHFVYLVHWTLYTGGDCRKTPQPRHLTCTRASSVQPHAISPARKQRRCWSTCVFFTCDQAWAQTVLGNENAVPVRAQWKLTHEKRTKTPT
jgi:hypothetical protein